MTNQERLVIVTAARGILADHYVPWTTDDGHGGHCHLGAVGLAACGNAHIYSYDGQWSPLPLFDLAAQRMHPELAGSHRDRDILYGGDDIFDERPAVFVNNQLGKEAILAVYDEVISQLEVAILCDQETERLRSDVKVTQEEIHAAK